MQKVGLVPPSKASAEFEPAKEGFASASSESQPAFDHLLKNAGSAHKAAVTQTVQTAAQTTKESGRLTLSFEDRKNAKSTKPNPKDNPPSAEMLAAQSLPGHALNQARLREQHGENRDKSHFLGSSTEHSERIRQKTQSAAIGANRLAGRSAVHVDTETIHKGKLAASALSEKGKALDGRELTTRADGTPVVRDENGQVRTLGASDPDKSLETYLTKDATAEERGQLGKRLAAQAAQNAANEADPHKAYAKQGEKALSEGLKRMAGNVANELAHAEVLKPAVAQKTAERPANDGKSKVEAARKEADAEAAQSRKSVGGAPENRPTQAVNPAKEATVHTETRGRSAEALKEIKAVKSTHGTETTLVSSTPTASVDGRELARALGAQDTHMAAGRLTAALEAQMHFIAQNARPEVRLDLNPARLGAIAVRLVAAADGKTEVSMKAEDASVGRLLEEAAPQLARQLAKVGVNVGEIMVEYGDTDAFGASTPGGGQAGGGPADSLPEREFVEDASEVPVKGGKARSERPHDGELDVLA